VEVPYLTNDAKPSSEVHDLLHYVIGGYDPDNSKGRIRVNGVMTDSHGEPTHKAGDGAALITVEEGWAWVSDKPPSASALCASGVALSGPGGPSDRAGPQDTPGSARALIWTGWSILTLLNAEWTWAGAIGTEFVYRVAASDPATTVQIHTVYGLSGSDAMIGWRPTPWDSPVLYAIKNGWFRRAKNGGMPSAPSPILGVASEQAFVDHIREQLEFVGVGARPDCQ
ncbi:MAG: hypothetical protein K8E66_02835, partial [Phycisphaerales bacterium]|nr:hypothetical protein [Phycisphaerales bacterium]